MPPFVNLAGQRFGRWAVIQRDADYRPGVPTWLCRCECGNERVVRASILRAGKSRSCGCFNIDVHRQSCIVRNTTHGQSKSTEHTTWVNIIQRCTNPKSTNYPAYGARGVTVCDRWRSSFEAFLADMGPKPMPGYTIDRIDWTKGYEPGNCRWASHKTQQNNRTNNRRLFFNGQSRTLAEWQSVTGIGQTTIRRRIDVLGWSVERTLTEPAVRGRNQYDKGPKP